MDFFWSLDTFFRIAFAISKRQLKVIVGAWMMNDELKIDVLRDREFLRIK